MSQTCEKADLPLPDLYGNLSMGIDPKFSQGEKVACRNQTAAQ